MSRPIASRLLPFSLATPALVLLVACGGGGGGGSSAPPAPPPAPSGLSYALNPAIYTLGAAISPNAPSSGGGAVASYAVAPSLPAGLSLSPSTGILSGTPTALAAQTGYVVTATNASGSAQATLSLTVKDAAPAFSYGTVPAIFPRGVPIAALTPTSTGGTILSWTVAPALPAGLSLSPSTGILSGTPTALAAQAGYVVTATNASGSAQATLTLTVKDQLPIFSYGSVPPVFAKGIAIAALTPTSTGGIILSWSVNPALPAGLNFNTATGIVSGTPTAGTPTAYYTFSATNSEGTVGQVFALAVVDAAPHITAFQAAPPFTLFGDSTILTWSLGTGTNDTLNLTLNGTPQTGIPVGGAGVTPVRRSTYVLTATNPLGSVTAPLTVAAKGLDLLAGNADGAGSLNGPALSARFYSPNAVAVDASGKVYIADSGNSTIRLLSGGYVDTLAGSPGLRGSVDGSALAARFGNPGGIAVDASGNVYVADTANHAIRKIMPPGVVSTLAGQASVSGSADGSGSNASFNEPTGLVVDASGNLYVSDTRNNTIRKVTPAGLVSTLAGSPGQFGSADGTGAAASFILPAGLALDAVGNLYISDQGNDTIRMLTPAGVVTTVAGLAGSPGTSDGTGSAARFYSPNGLAFDRATGNLYVADQNASTIRKVTSAGVVSTVAGGGAGEGSTDGHATVARFYRPTGVALLPNGNLLIVELGNHTLRTLDTAGNVTTTAGQAPLTGATDATGALARFANPQGLAVTSTGDTFVADWLNFLIRKVSTTGVVTTFAGSQSIPYGADGTGTGASIPWPWALAVDSSDNLYLTGDANTIRRITPGAVVTTLAGTPNVTGSADGTGAAASFYEPQAIAVDSARNLYVADTRNHTIRKVTPAGVVTTLAGLAGNPGFVNATGNAARFSSPEGIAVDAGGNVYVADDSHCIRKITPAGVVTTFAGNGAPGYLDGTGTGAWFNSPGGLAFTPSGNLYVCDRMNHAIRKITPTGVVTTPVGAAQVAGLGLGRFPGGLFYPLGLAITPAGDLVIITNNGVVQATLPD